MPDQHEEADWSLTVVKGIVEEPQGWKFAFRRPWDVSSLVASRESEYAIKELSTDNGSEPRVTGFQFWLTYWHDNRYCFQDQQGLQLPARYQEHGEMQSLR